MKAEVRGTHTCKDAFREPAPPGPQVSKGRTEVQIKERMNNSELREDQETADARPRISKDRHKGKKSEQVHRDQSFKEIA